MAELTYTRTKNYLIPDIKLEETEDRLLGKYGRMRRAYLKEIQHAHALSSKIFRTFSHGESAYCPLLRCCQAEESGAKSLLNTGQNVPLSSRLDRL